MAARIATIRRSDLQVVIVVYVAVGAGRSGMAEGQWKSGKAVIEVGRIPSLWRVAGRAVRRAKDGARRRVWRIIGLLPSGQVAAGIAAIRRSNL